MIPFNVRAVDPTYILMIRNMSKPFPNTLEFDLYMVHTNNGSANFEYAGGQYYFDFNPVIGNGGSFTYSIVQSDLPQNLQPRNPVVYLDGGATQLRLSLNTIPNPGSGYTISAALPGTKIVRMRLVTNAKSFSNTFLQMRWRNGPNNPYTKIFAFVNSVFTEVTTPQNHLIDSLQNPLPVEMKSFAATAVENNVILTWGTSREINNQGFQIERNRDNTGWTVAGFIEGNGNSETPHEYSFEDKHLKTGTYNYRLKQFDYNGNFEYYYVQNKVTIVPPENFFLSQNYPNPFNPSTKIDFSIPFDADMKIIVFDVNGKEVETLFDGFKTSGIYSVEFVGSKLSSGIYFYALYVNEQKKEIRSMMLVK